MIDPRKFRHGRSVYERPQLPYECGRARLWAKPCWQGPGLDGRCGGEAECRPVRKGDRWECRRPARAGGPCAQGALPDGRCAHVSPPCLPRACLRRRRGRLSLFAVIVAACAIAAMANFSTGPSISRAAMDPGPLSSMHAGFIRDEGCGACHAPHEAGAIGWLSAAFSPQDRSERCLRCHTFRGEERSAHNERFADRPDLPVLACSACHTEHRGADFDLAKVSDAICGNCHRDAFDSFETDHPGFASDFPYQVPNSIRFDHTKHLGEYFVEARWTGQSSRDAGFAERARRNCTVCHEVERATREVTPKGYDEVCANCHAAQIPARAMLLYSPEEPTALSALLLDIGADDDNWEEAAGAFLEALAEESIDALADRLDALSGEAPVLLAGLNAVVLSEAARRWIEEEEYEPVIEPEVTLNGWSVGSDPDGGQSIYYVPSGHADAMLKAWIGLALAAREAGNEQASEALAYLLDAEDGPGACGKCHGAGVARAGSGAAQWRFSGPVARPRTLYSHAPHIDLLGPDLSCKNCHVLDNNAPYAAFFDAADQTYASNFHAIDKNTCDKCHRTGAVRFDCQLCHRYHLKPAFKMAFQRTGAE